MSFGIGVAAQTSGNPNFNTGIQLSIKATDPDGNPVDWGGEVIDFQATPIFHDAESNPISNRGEPDFQDHPRGWHGTITIDRYNGAMDVRQGLHEELYHSGGLFLKYTLTRRIKNGDGSVNISQFMRASMRLDDPGSWTIGNPVPIKVTFRASRCIILS